MWWVSMECGCGMRGEIRRAGEENMPTREEVSADSARTERPRRASWSARDPGMTPCRFGNPLKIMDFRTLLRRVEIASGGRLGESGMALMPYGYTWRDDGSRPSAGLVREPNQPLEVALPVAIALEVTTS